MRFPAALGLAALVHAALALGLALAWPRARGVPVEIVAAVEVESVGSTAPAGPPPAVPLAGPPAAVDAHKSHAPKALVRAGAESIGVAIPAAGDGEPGAPADDGRGEGTAPEGVTAGSGGSSGVPHASGAGGGGGGPDRTALIAEARARIRSHRRYPELSRRRGVEGIVGLAFRVQPDGHVTDLVVRRSADPALDEAAREAVLSAMPLPPLGEVEIDLDFHLQER